METNLKNILSWIIKGLLFIVPFIPLYIAKPLFFPFITGKAFVFRAIVEIAFALWLVLIVFYKEYRPRKNALLWAISIFILVVTLATMVGVNPLKSFWSNFERMEGLVMYLHLFAYFLVLGNVFKKRDWLIFFNAFIVSGLIEGGYALMQKMGKVASPQGGFRVDGTIGNPAYLAAFLIFISGFSAWLFLKTKNVYARVYYAASCLFSLLIIYFTASRGPVLGILVAAFLMIAGYLLFKKSETEKKQQNQDIKTSDAPDIRGPNIIPVPRPRMSQNSSPHGKKIALGGLIALFAVIGLLWGFRNSSFVKNNEILSRLTNLSFKETTITARLEIWQMSWQGFKEKPVLGWGPENYLSVFSKYYQPAMWKQEPWFDRSHNIIFDWFINAGILGLLSYLAIFLFAFRELYKNYKSKRIAFEELILIAGVFIAYFFQNLFVFDNLATYVSFFAILAWIYNVSNQEERAKLETRKSEFDVNYSPLVITAVLAVSVFYAYFINIKPFLANKNLIQAIVSRNTPVTAFEYYQKAFSQNTFLGRDEISMQFVNFAVSAFRDQNLAGDKKQEIFELAIKELDGIKTQNPTDPRPFMYASLIYDAVNQPEKAIEEMSAARRLSPKKQDIAISLANMYLNQKQYDKALPILRQTFEGAEEYPQARMALAGAYILTGEQQKADQLLMEGFGKVDVANDYLIKIYYSVGRYDRIVGIWKSYVAENPKNAEYRQRLAGAYLLNGQVNEAIGELKVIIDLDPSKESEVNELIRQILEGEL